MLGLGGDRLLFIILCNKLPNSICFFFKDLKIIDQVFDKVDSSMEMFDKEMLELQDFPCGSLKNLDTTYRYQRRGQMTLYKKRSFSSLNH